MPRQCPRGQNQGDVIIINVDSINLQRGSPSKNYRDCLWSLELDKEGPASKITMRSREDL